jgi:hypothetical protein
MVGFLPNFDRNLLDFWYIPDFYDEYVDGGQKLHFKITFRG